MYYYGTLGFYKCHLKEVLIRNFAFNQEKKSHNINLITETSVFLSV